MEQTRLHIEFFTDAVENQNKPREAVRPIFEDREFIRIKFPGDNKREHVAPAHEMHYVQEAKRQMTYAEQYPQHYDAFKRDGAASVVGTPLDELTFLTKSHRSELRALNVHTAEQLAGLDDRALAKFGPGFRELKEQAATYLEAATGNAEMDAMRREIEDLKAALGQKAAATAPTPEDPFADLTEDDLKNMLRDAGRAIPPGRASREKLIEALTKEDEAA